MAAVSSAEVGQKINEWYRHIKKFNVTDAEMLRTEIRRELDVMEEDEQAVLYFQLMEFRHQQMLEYVNPVEQKVNKAEYLRAVEGQGKKMTGILEYYFNFFRGMYEFSQGDYIKAITFYRYAEKKLDKVIDELERAEFYYKMAEIFYHMKQTHMSMYYIMLAHDAYRADARYIKREIHCHFVISGNYDDLQSYEKSLPHLKDALSKAKDIKDKFMISTCLLNMGNCYQRSQKYDEALAVLTDSLPYLTSIKHDHLKIAYYQCALVYFKTGLYETAVEFLNKGFDFIRGNKDELYQHLFDFLKKLYVEADYVGLVELLKNFDHARGYPYLEELALEVAEFYTGVGRMEDSVYFYQQMVYAQKQIRRGDCLYDY
ncbi:tetratricopeptide repeat protein [Bacillus safensis]|uniref:Rap family tetratricopeptide repeat protein n=1 Tax=Bacillus safensis TaxID=561879 RepID=UPI00227FB083|nr:Rap family tetratricopeptide repeat protein [Bacillus safensis]MCY7589492.1 tetratricopeptide repeat protein [Bacillus safensis]